MLNDSEVQRILVVNAHPDDVDFSAAGTVALWTDAGIEVTYCVVTDGDAGGHDESVPRAEIPRCAARSRPPPPSRSGCMTCGSSDTPTAGWNPRWRCAGTSRG